MAARNLQIVEAAAPLGAGFWIAVHRDRAVVMFGGPPDAVAGLLRGLIHRGGLRADVVRGGRIRAGDPVRTID